MEVYFSQIMTYAKMNSKEIARFRRDYLGFVFQEYNLIDTLTASEI